MKSPAHATSLLPFLTIKTLATAGGKDGQGREHREQSKPYSSMLIWSELGRGEAANFDPIELVNTLKFNTSWKHGSLMMGKVTWLSTFKQISITNVLSWNDCKVSLLFK